MKRNEIIKHYKDFFDLHAKGIALDEEDQLILDWAENLIKSSVLSLHQKEHEPTMSQPMEQEGDAEKWLEKEHPAFCNRVKRDVSELHLSVYAALMEQYADSRIAEWDKVSVEVCECDKPVSDMEYADCCGKCGNKIK